MVHEHPEARGRVTDTPLRREFRYMWRRASGARREALRLWAYRIGCEDITEEDTSGGVA